jgi:TonB-dependent receptor
VSRLIRLLFVVAVLFNLVSVTSSKAQSSVGAVVGSAKDSAGSALQGALVELLPSGKRTVTDAQGQFRIPDVAPGEYTLSVSYVGFKPAEKKIVVAAAGSETADVVLEVASQADQVLVTGERLQGEAEAINITRTADNIVQVLPSRVILSLPNTNIADAVGRLPSVTLERDEGEGKYVQIRGTEPRLSNVTINGIHVPSPEAAVRNIKLDVIPSGLVERIEVNKTLSANQDGDAIGGSINLVTKTPGDRPTFDFGVQGGYTPIQNGRWLDSGYATAGDRFGVRKQWGVLFGTTYDYNARGIDDLEPTQAIGQNPANGANIALINSEDFRTYKYDRTRYGFGVDTDYNIKSGSNLYFRGLYSDFHDFGDTWVYTPNAGNTISSVNGSQIAFDPCTEPTPPPGCTPGSMKFRHYIRRPDQQIFSFSVGGTHDLTKTLITYEFAVSRAHNIGGQDFATTRFVGPANVNFSLDQSDPYRPKLIAPSSASIYDPSTYALTSTTVPFYHSTQLDFQGSATAARRYNWNNHFGVFDLGLKIRSQHKYQSERDHNYSANNTYLMTPLVGPYRNPNYYDKSYTVGPMTNYDYIRNLLATQLSTGFTDDPNGNQLINDAATWDLTERVYAGYFMNTITFGKFRVQGGLRIEGTNANYNANEVRTNPGGGTYTTTPVTGDGSYVNFMPSVQVQYQLQKNTILRATYGRGISRPNFQDQVPSRQVDPNTTPKSLQIGNPTLKPTRANNYDVLIEHYFSSLGIIQGGFFYKDLSDPIYPTITNLTSGPFAGYQQQQSINGPNAHIAGIELAWEQRLSRLPGLLSGFGVSANYSYTNSQVSFPTGFSGGRIDHPSLQRQAPNTWNLGFTYDKARFSMRFGVSHNDANIYAYGFVHDPANPQNDKDPILGIKGPLGDQYLYAHTQFDIQGSYRIYKGVQIVGSGLNLSNEVFGFYTGSKIYPNQREYYKPTVMLGLRWTSSAE